MISRFRFAATTTIWITLTLLGFGSTAYAAPIEVFFTLDNKGFEEDQEGQVTGVFRGLEDVPGVQQVTEIEIFTNTATPSFGVGTVFPYLDFNFFEITEGRLTRAAVLAFDTADITSFTEKTVTFYLDITGTGFGAEYTPGAQLATGGGYGGNRLVEGSITIDAIRRAEVPSPPTLALLALGLCALVASRHPGPRFKRCV